MATWKGLPRAGVVVKPAYDFLSGSEGAGISVTATGLQALEDTLRGMSKGMRDAAGYEMADIMAEVIVDAQEGGYIPVETHALFDSGRSDAYDPGANFTLTRIAAWFGGAISESEWGKIITAGRNEGIGTPRNPENYAWYVHELPFNHPDGGGMKYLEIPFNLKQPLIIGRIANACGFVLGDDAATEPAGAPDPLAEIHSRLMARKIYPRYGRKK